MDGVAEGTSEEPQGTVGRLMKKVLKHPPDQKGVPK